MKLKFNPSQPGCGIPYDELRNNLIRELRLYGTGEPYWFGRSSITPLLEWLDEVLIVDQHQWKIVAVDSSYFSYR